LTLLAVTVRRRYLITALVCVLAIVYFAIPGDIRAFFNAVFAITGAVARIGRVEIVAAGFTCLYICLRAFIRKPCFGDTVK
jgi:hypothetical protein